MCDERPLRDGRLGWMHLSYLSIFAFERHSLKAN